MPLIMVFLSKSNNMVNSMRNANFLLLILIGIFQLVSCENSTKVEDNAKISKVLKYETLIQDGQSLQINSAVSKTLVSLTDEQQFFTDLNITNQTKQTFILNAGLDRIDYDKQMVIIISTGKIHGKKSYINIDEVKLTDNKIFVSATKYIKSTSDNNDYYPIQIIKLNKSASEVVFNQIKEVILKDENQDRDIPFKVILKNTGMVFTGQQFFTIKSKDEETAYTDTVSGNKDLLKSSLPETDYNKEMLIVMQYGETSSGSNYLDITNIKLISGKLNVKSQLTIPSVGLDNIGHPFIIAKLEKLDNPIVFETPDIVHLIDSNATPLVLTGTKWKFTGFIDNSGNYTEVSTMNSIRPDDFTLDFSSTSFTGKSNCNTISGKYLIANSNFNSIQIYDFTTTKVNCVWSDRFNTSLKTAYEVYIQNSEQYGQRLYLRSTNTELPQLYFEPIY